MIKSKIDARERAMELAIIFVGNQNITKLDGERSVLGIAEAIEKYIVGDVNLPETEPLWAVYDIDNTRKKIK